jgi:hypothetical protein
MEPRELILPRGFPFFTRAASMSPEMCTPTPDSERFRSPGRPESAVSGFRWKPMLDITRRQFINARWCSSNVAACGAGAAAEVSTTAFFARHFKDNRGSLVYSHSRWTHRRRTRVG